MQAQWCDCVLNKMIEPHTPSKENIWAMLEIWDFLEFQNECIHNVWGEPSRTHFCQKWDQGGFGLGPDYYIDPSPSQQESRAVLLGQDKLPQEVHLRLCIDNQAHAGHDKERYSLQLGQEGKICIRPDQAGHCRSACTLEPIFQEIFLVIHLHLW